MKGGLTGMTRAADVAELVLGEIRASDGVAFSHTRYRDEPILYTGAQMPGRVPERIKEMRALARKAGWHSFAYGGARLFYEQAHFMAGFEDDCPYLGQFERYFPTYEDMPDRILRGYFTWRTRYRAGRVEDAPLSFLFVHAYELLCGAGVEPGTQGYRKLQELRQAYGARYKALDVHLSRWRRDYALYHGLDAGLSGAGSAPGGGMSFAQAVCLLRQAEEALVKRDAADVSAMPGAADLFEALSVAGRYHVGKSAALRNHRDELVESCCAAFASMVAHCARRRKKGLVDGAFGLPEERAFKMFASAVFHDPQVHADAEHDLGFGEAILCRGGMWYRRLPYTTAETSVELGNLMHAVDAALRNRAGDVPDLKAREVPAFLRKMAQEAVDAVLARRAAEEAARVRIDRSALAGIRRAADATCESLLVDEERDVAVPGEGAAADAELPGGYTPDNVVAGAGLPGSCAPWERCSPGDYPRCAIPREPRTVENSPIGHAPSVAFPSPSGLSPYQLQLMHALLDGAPAPAPPAGTTLAMEVDAVNEALFDLVGDTCIEFDGETPRIVEDYRDDLREVLQ